MHKPSNITEKVIQETHTPSQGVKSPKAEWLGLVFRSHKNATKLRLIWQSKYSGDLNVGSLLKYEK